MKKRDDIPMMYTNVPVLKKRKAKDVLGDIIANSRGKNDNGTMVNVDITKEERVLGPGLKVVVQVYSVIKPGRIQQGERFFYKNDFNTLPAVVEALGGALAESCCEKYGDDIDPSEYAAAAKGALRKTIMEYEQSNRLTKGVVKL